MTRDRNIMNHKRRYFIINLIPGPSDLFIALVIATTYLMCQIYINVANKSHCNDRRHAYDVIEMNEAEMYTTQAVSEFENQIILEFRSLNQICDDNTWNANECRGNSCTRVLWENATNVDNTTDYTTRKPKTIPVKATPYTGIKLMNCEEMSKLFEREMSIEFVEVPTPANEVLSGLKIKRGTVKPPFFSATRFVNIKEADVNTKGYEYLVNELEKRQRLGWNIPGLQEFYGACKTEKKIRLADEFVQGPSLCDEEIKYNDQFEGTVCYNMQKLKHLINKIEDRPKATLKFISSIICLFGELEKKKFFVDNIHGSMFKLKDMSVVLTSLDDALYYGGTNVYGEGICLYNSQCPSPIGTNWYNGSANDVFYKKCQDIKPKCQENRCVGFNASMHLCGLSRWLQNLYELLENDLEKSRFLHAMTLVSHSSPAYRKSGNMACFELKQALYKYNKANKPATYRKKSNSFHVGVIKKPAKEKK